MRLTENFRLLSLGIFLCCLGLLGFGLFLQHGLHLEPCPLCIMQRVAYIGVALVALAATLHNPKRWGRAVWGGLMALAALAGAGVAGRNVWLQHLPADQVPECGPGLEYMLDHLPLTQTLAKVLKGSGDCAEVLWSFLGLSIAEWSLLWFFLLTAAGLYLAWLGCRKGKEAFA